jgi:phosphoribosylformylglycinamidine synthase
MPRAKVYITYKPGVVDPQGLAIRGALLSLGFKEVQEVRVGKFIEVGLEGSSLDELRLRLRTMCERLLANPVIEDYRFELEGEGPGPKGEGG